MADVFVSYSRVNRDRVAAIGAALEAGGRSLWWDRQLASGQDYGTVIEREIDAARCVVVAWSATARDSLWVRAEANAALDQGKLVQVNLDGARLPLPFTMLHFLDLSGWSGARQQAPWPDLEARVDEQLHGGADTGRRPDAGGIPFVATPERALQGFGQAALMGWTAIVTAAIVGLATLLVARESIGGQVYAVLGLVALVLSLGLTALSAAVLMRAQRAGRR